MSHSSPVNAEVRQLLGAFYKTVDVMKSARNSQSKTMNIWPDDIKAVEDVMFFLENLRDGIHAQQMRGPSDEQISSACLSYRHDYGLLTTSTQKQLRLEAQEWMRAWQKEGFCYNSLARREEAGKAGAESVERTSSELNHSPSGNLVPSRDSERERYSPTLKPGADKSEKGASPRSADELPTNASRLRATPLCPRWPKCRCITQGYVNPREPYDCGRKPPPSFTSPKCGDGA